MDSHLHELDTLVPRHTPGSTLLDNSTLQSALGLIEGDDHFLRPDAWTISFESLRVFIDSLILFSSVYVDELDIEWATSNCSDNTTHSIKSVVHPLRIPTGLREIIRQNALGELGNLDQNELKSVFQK